MKVIQEYIEHQELLINVWVGSWNLNDYKECIDLFNRLSSALKISRVLQDITLVEYSDSYLINNHKLVSDLMNARNKIQNIEYKVVFLTKKPEDIVMSHLYAHEINDPSSYLYCSTPAKVLEIFNIPQEDLDLESKLYILRKKN